MLSTPSRVHRQGPHDEHHNEVGEDAKQRCRGGEVMGPGPAENQNRGNISHRQAHADPQNSIDVRVKR